MKHATLWLLLLAALPAFAEDISPDIKIAQAAAAARDARLAAPAPTPNYQAQQVTVLKEQLQQLEIQNARLRNIEVAVDKK
jgi:hypothetical protein